MSRHYAMNNPVMDRTASHSVVVADDLTRLHEPSVRIVALPITLSWTPRSAYDLGNPTARRSLYQVVLREALDKAELEEHLGAHLLQQLWPTLILPRTLRAAWEQQHPSLAV